MDRCNPRKCIRKCGHSLVEVMVAFAILTVVFTSITKGLDFAMKTSASSELRSTANALLAGEAEFLRSLEWNALGTLPEEAAFANENVPDRFTTERLAMEPEIGLRTYRLAVGWTDPLGRSQTAVVVVAVTAGGITT